MQHVINHILADLLCLLPCVDAECHCEASEVTVGLDKLMVQKSTFRAESHNKGRQCMTQRDSLTGFLIRSLNTLISAAFSNLFLEEDDGEAPDGH